MARRIWAGALAGYVLPLVEYVHPNGTHVDRDLADPEIPITVEVGQILSFAAESVGLDWPEQDRHMTAFLEREARTAPAPHLWMVCTTASGRLGFVVPGGVVETTGEHLTRVEHPEPDRYTAHYYLPGVYYVGSNRSAQ